MPTFEQLAHGYKMWLANSIGFAIFMNNNLFAKKDMLLNKEIILN
jgi:hypothetical protein